MVRDELIRTHKQHISNRALHKLLRSQKSDTIGNTEIKKCDTILFFYKSTNNIEEGEWKEGVAQKGWPEFVEIDTGRKGPNPKIAYEDLRMKQISLLSLEFLQKETGKSHEGKRLDRDHKDSTYIKFMGGQSVWQ